MRKSLTLLIVVFSLTGCATTQKQYVFTPTVLSFSINASAEDIFTSLQKTIKSHPFKIVHVSEADHAILATSKFSAPQKAGLFMGKLLAGISYNDQISFEVIPQEKSNELRIAIVAFQRMPSLVEQIPVDSKNQLYKEASRLAQEIKEQAEQK